MKAKNLLVTLLVTCVIALMGCAQLGLQPAQSFNDRAGYALATHTAVLDATTSALKVGDITSAEAESVADIADNARKLIDSARAVKSAGDAAGADKTLASATAILRELQNYLREKSS